MVLNAAPCRYCQIRLLDCIDVLIVNEGELRALAGPKGIAQCLSASGVPTVIVTLGSRVAWPASAARLYVQTAFAITAVDTTGAGDTFCGTLVAALSQGFPVARCLAHASAAGALACTRHGGADQRTRSLGGRKPGGARGAACAVEAHKAYCGIEPEHAMVLNPPHTK